MFASKSLAKRIRAIEALGGGGGRRGRVGGRRGRVHIGRRRVLSQSRGGECDVLGWGRGRRDAGGEVARGGDVRSRGCELVREFLSGVQRLLAALVESRGVDVRIVIARAAVGRVPENGGEARLETFLVLASGRVGRVGAPGGGRRGVRPGGQLLSQRRALGLLLALVLFQAFLAALEVPRLAVHGDGTDSGTVGARGLESPEGSIDERSDLSVGARASRKSRAIAESSRARLADDGAFASV